jgi:hypothetical protein
LTPWFCTTAGADIEVDGFIVHTVMDETTLQLITQAAGGNIMPRRAIKIHRPCMLTGPAAV